MSEDGVLFSKDKKTLITWSDGKESDSYTVPSTVTNIMSRAFDYQSPSVITIPSSVKNIDNDAFFFAQTKTIIIESKDISIGLSAFEASGLESLYFTGTKDEWSGVSKGDRWCLTSKLGNDPAVKQVTFKVENGKWNDGSTADKVITVVGNNADKLIGSVIPTVGSKPATDYAAGSWDNDPLAATLTGDTVFTYTYSKTAGTAVTAKITVSKTDITGENTVEDALLSLSVQGLTDDQIENIIESNEGNGLKNWSTAQDGNTFTMSWVSGSKAADIKGLAPGTYTLAETGDAFESNGVTYEVLDSEVVFIINESGKVIYRTVPAPSDELNPENSTISYARASGNTFTVCDASRTDITVSKKEITNTEEIKGAHLVIEDRAGNVIDEWDSNGSDHIVKALANGTYVLTETAVDSEQAGSAYKIIPSSVYFTVLNGKITEVTSRILADKPENGSKDGYVLCNEDENLITVCDAKQTTKVTVNKYDITGKEELDGAILTIKDSDGKTLTGTPWTSSKGRKLVVELENGTYTLTETGDTVTDEDGNEYEIIDSILTFSVENGRLTVVDNSTSSNSGEGFYDVDSDTNSIAVNDVMKTQEATITWKQDDGTVIDTTSVKYGQSPTHKDPTKQKDNQYIYTFTGWSDGTNTYGKNDTLPEVTADATYTAVYSQRSYMGSVKFIAVAEDDRIKSQTVVIKVFDSATEGTNYTSYGAISVSGTGEFDTTMTHIPEGDYTYSVEPGNTDTYVSPRTGTFSITGEETTEVKFNLVIPVKSYRVTFVNDDGEFTILQSTLVDEGETPVYSGNTPTKQGDAHYSYSFAGWTDGTNTYGKDDPLPEVTGDVTYTAVYDSNVNSYTITWKQDDGTLIGTTTVEYGKTPTHADPTKEPDEQYTYTFAGWDSKIIPVTGEATYTATYTATLRSYTITWKQDDGTEIDTTTVEYGQMPTHADLTKEASAEFTYTFAGWTPEISSVKGEATYKATYSATVNEYTIIFKNEDGTVLQTVTVAYGETPEYTGETPTKAEDANNTYSFAGWNQDISAVTGETEYTATFTATQKASPDTGDSSLEIWAIAMVASFACLAMIPVYGRKRAKEK